MNGRKVDVVSAVLLTVVTVAVIAFAVHFVMHKQVTIGVVLWLLAVITAIGALRALGIVPGAVDPGDGQ